jgi:phosphate transport system permease protein
MTDASNAAPLREKKSLLVVDARTKKRNAAEARFKMYGIIAITLGLLFLAVLLTTIISRGTGAFAQTFISVPVELREDKLDKKGNRNLEDIKKVSTFGYNPLLGNALSAVILQKVASQLKSPKAKSCANFCPQVLLGKCAPT